MRFTVEHKLPRTLAQLDALIVDPTLYERMARALPNMERIEFLESDDLDGILRRRVR
jgi:hypothetical protein